MVMQLAIKEVIQQRVRQEAEEYREKFINEQKREHEKAVEEYERLLTEHYQSEIRLEFFKAINKLNAGSEKHMNLDELNQQQILLLKKIKDIESSGALESYDAVMEAIKAVNKE